MSDLEGITEVYQSAYPDETDYPLVFRENVETMLENGDIDYYVVEGEDGSIYATAANLYNSLNSGNVQPGRLAVAKDSRGKGLGKALLAERTKDLLEKDPEGIAFSGGATSHSASQGNLFGRGYEVFCVDRQVNESYFGNNRETEIMFIHPETVERDSREIYLPEEYVEIAEKNLGKISEDLAGRKIVASNPEEIDTDGEFGIHDEIGFLTQIDAHGNDREFDEVIESLERDRENEDHLMIPVDANSRDTVPLYRAFQDMGFNLSGFAPDWFSLDGENRDALLMQYSPQKPETVEVIEPVKELLEDIGAEFEEVERTEVGWRLRY